MKSNNNITLLIEVVVCLVLILLLSWSTMPSSIAIADIYAVYVKELSVFKFSTHSVFLIGNLIIIVIVVQSSTKLAENSTPARKVKFVPHHYNIADQQIKLSDPRHYMADEKINSRPQLQSNLNIRDNALTREAHSVSEQSIVPAPEKVSVKLESSQVYRRTMSASYERGGEKVKRTVSKPELKRSKTVRLRTGETSTLVAGRFDELNHEEFRLKIESFIEKQRRSIREELVVAGSGEHGFSFRR